MNISVRSLSFGYAPEKEIFKNLAFDLSPGKLIFLLGANGSGKSTLVKLLCGLLKGQSGKILLGEKPLEEYSPNSRARHIGVMLQQSPPALDFTVGELVLFGRTAKLPRLAPPGEEDHAAVRRALDKTGMSAFASRRANTLSGGEFQRAVMASVLALESEVIFLDEPVSAQDPAQTAFLFEKLALLAREKTLLVISHDLDLACRYGGRLLLLADGAVFADGAPQQVLTSQNLQKLYKIPASLAAAFEKRF